MNFYISIAALLLAISSSAQVLTFRAPSFDFGDIGNVNPVSHEVEFSNSGDKELIISKVKGSCGCTTGTLESKALQPGESGSVTVTFNPQGRSGKQRKRVIFTTNDIEKEIKSISFTANIVPLWDTDPDRLEFVVNDQGDGYRKSEEKFVIRNVGEKPLVIEKVYTNGTKLEVADLGVKDVQPGGSLEVAIKVKPEFIPERNHFDLIRINAKVDGQSTNGKVRVNIRNPNYKRN